MTGQASNRRLVIGVTGGIGSGKSAATDAFAALGVDVVDADVVSRQVVLPGSDALASISEHFGEQILQADGSLDRKALRARIFSDPQEKQWLESLLHPLIRHQTEARLLQGSSAYVILSSPLLLETDQHKLVDRVLLIDVPEQLQIERTRKRDQTTTAAVQAIMAAQLDRQQRLQRADDVILNDQDLDQLRARVLEAHQRYESLAASFNDGRQPSQ